MLADNFTHPGLERKSSEPAAPCAAPVSTDDPAPGDGAARPPGLLLPEPPPQGRCLDYPFDAVPARCRQDGRLKHVDHVVLAILISFALLRPDSCWVAIGTIAARLPSSRPGKKNAWGSCDRTVERSLQRLRTTKYIRHERVAKPDPDDCRNMTGWRFYLDFALPLAPEFLRPGEVTMTTGKGAVAPPPPATDVVPLRKVTSESADSKDTQARIEFSEQETSLNVGVNVNEASLGPDGAKTLPGVEPPQAELPQPSPAAVEPTLAADEPSKAPSAEDIEKHIAMIRSKAKCSLRVMAYRQLEESGNLPLDLIGTFPPKPPEAKSSTHQAGKAAPPPPPRPQDSASAPKDSPVPVSTEVLIRRLSGPLEGAQARARQVATRLAEQWKDPDSLHGFIPKLLRAAQGEIPIIAVLKAYRTATKCGPNARPGAIFHHKLNTLIGKGHDRARGTKAGWGPPQGPPVAERAASPPG